MSPRFTQALVDLMQSQASLDQPMMEEVRGRFAREVGWRDFGEIKGVVLCVYGNEEQAAGAVFLPNSYNEPSTMEPWKKTVFSTILRNGNGSRILISRRAPVLAGGRARKGNSLTSANCFRRTHETVDANV